MRGWGDVGWSEVGCEGDCGERGGDGGVRGWGHVG